MSETRNAALARNWWAIAVRGVLAIIVGIVALIAPSAAILTLTWLLAAYLLLDGAFAVVSAIRTAERHGRWGLLALEGIANLVVGGIVFYFPAGAIVAIVLILAGWALVTGGLMLISSFRLHGSHGRLWLALGGLVSLIWGFLLAAVPFTGAVVLTWWFGAYAIAFGVMLLILGFRLRGRHRTELGRA